MYDGLCDGQETWPPRMEKRMRSELTATQENTSITADSILAKKGNLGVMSMTLSPPSYAQD